MIRVRVDRATYYGGKRCEVGDELEIQDYQLDAMRASVTPVGECADPTPVVVEEPAADPVPVADEGLSPAPEPEPAPYLGFAAVTEPEEAEGSLVDTEEVDEDPDVL